MDKKGKTAQALKKKKSTLMELEAQAQKVAFSCLLCEWCLFP